MPTERIKVNLSDAADLATQKFFKLLDVASWDTLKNKVQSPPAGGRASRKQRLAEARNRQAQLFGGEQAAQETPVGASDKTMDELVKEIVEGL